jgi:hypothetical protein
LSIQEKLRPQIEALVSMMLGYLKDAHISHQEASCRAAVMDRETLALQGGRLEAPKPPPIKQDTSALTDALRQLFRRAQELGEPVQMIEFRFRRSGEWIHQVMIETLAAHEKLEQERAALDQAVAQSMIAAAGEAWTRVTFERLPPAPAKLTAFLDRERRELAVTPELEALLQRAIRLYEKHGRELRWPRWRVEGNRRQFDVAAHMFYG